MKRLLLAAGSASGSVAVAFGARSPRQPRQVDTKLVVESGESHHDQLGNDFDAVDEDGYTLGSPFKDSCRSDQCVDGKFLGGTVAE